MSSTVSWTSSVSGSHDPAKTKMVHIDGDIYISAGVYYRRQPERRIPKYHRTGKPEFCTEYIGMDEGFDAEHLRIIVQHMGGGY